MADHAPSTPTPPGLRRHLAGAVLLPLAGTAVTILPVQPDAELICLCAEIDALEDFLTVRGRHEGKPGGPEEDEYDELVATVWKQQKELTDRICALPCISLAGLCAIGSTLASYLDRRGLEGDMNAYPEGRLLGRLLDLLISVGSCDPSSPA